MSFHFILFQHGKLRPTSVVCCLALELVLVLVLLVMVSVLVLVVVMALVFIIGDVICTDIGIGIDTIDTKVL